MDPVPWREAWHEALYAAGRGFYVTRGGPAAHFTTAANGPTGAALARALLRLPDHPVRVVVDVGAGRGELATHLVEALAALQRPAPTAPTPAGEWALSPGDGRAEVPTRRGEAVEAREVRVVAVDVVERPKGLDERIEWLLSPGGAHLPAELTDLRDALVIAHEWLDVVPCTVAEVDDSGTPREVLVDPTTGEESLGAPLTDEDHRWAEGHWPTTTPGDRLEVGLARDDAWATLVSRVSSGTLVAVDYGHTATARPPAGTLTAYASGRPTTPVPDGTRDLTAHVAMDSLCADEVRTQRESLQALGMTGATPAHALAATHPLGYLAALERASAEARLLDRDGYGAFWWAVKRVRGAT